ncbi:unnamed protein product, partial [Scytosiphon promiscuus]
SHETALARLSPFSRPISASIVARCTCGSQKGYIKRTPLAAFKSTSSRGLIIISLGDDDTLRWVKRCRDEDGIVIGSEQGYATRFLATAKDLRPSGRASRGVR